PVDTTGAGDAFNAGFLHAWLEAAPIETCLRAGNAAGGEAIMTLGGFKALPTATQFDLAGVR
ncbi:MAG: PfkB family carbohydrate kinase, partial [Pseudomonadota bacterium]